MYIEIGLILSIIIQFTAALVALSLLRRTKYNVSWILISIAFLLLAFRLTVEVFLFHTKQYWPQLSLISNWIGVLIAVMLLIGVVYIRKIFNLQRKIEHLRRQTENQVFRAIVATEESERLNFSKELHDGLGPLLSTIKMSISALKASEIDESKLEIINNIHVAINESISSIKEISNRLSPHVLNTFGLLSAIRSFINKLPTQSIDIIIQSNIESQRFKHDTEVVLYRVCCELIHNTIKHASASKITIDLHYQDGYLLLDYFDNGVGFDSEMLLQSVADRGMGLSNILSRVKSIHGTVNIHSEVNAGMFVSIAVAE